MGLSVSRVAAVAMPCVATAVVVRLMVAPPAQAPVRFSGDLTFEQYEHIIEHPFDVPAGVARIDVSLTHTGTERRTVVDLGLRGPSAVRGWSGGREKSIHVSSLSATPGYLPGPIESGRWSVMLGIANIRRESRDSYSVDIQFERRNAIRQAAALRTGARWYAGDLHLHSGHSDGRGLTRSGAAMPAPVHRVFDRVVESGLDFVALTDHNTAAHWLDIDRLQPYYDNLLLLHGREITTYRGHANAVGERGFSEFALAAPGTPVLPLLKGITRGGAFLSINHPLRPDDETCMGCGWNDGSFDVLSAVHGVEAVNGADWATRRSGWRFWADALNAGARLALVSGSDDHKPEDTTDGRPGSPTTMVFADELSEPALVRGLKSGRTYVRVRDARGPTIELAAFVNRRRHQLGDTIRLKPFTMVSLEATVSGASGQTLQWMRRGEPIESTDLSGDGIVRLELQAAPGDWFSVNIVDDEGPTLLTSAIYTE
jgi:hypothetical protein